MAVDDRERNFEKAMARELRGDALNGLHCPDAETLAAYHERLLSPEEMAAQKSHIASCARCQEVLATLEVTEAVSNEALEAVQEASATEQKALRAVAPAPAVSRQEEAAAASAKVREMPKPKAYLHWAVPAGAIAAGLLVWVAINGSRSPHTAQNAKTDSGPVEVAENREQKKPQLSAPAAQATAPTAKAESELKADADERYVPAPEADKEFRDRLEKSGGFSARRSQGLPHGPAVLQNQMQNQIQNNTNASEFSLRQNQAADGAGSSSGVAAGGDLSASVPPVQAGSPRKKVQEAAKAAPSPAPPVANAPAAGDAGERKDVGRVSESVEVTAAAPLLETEPTTKQKMSLDDKAVNQLPTTGRNQNEMAVLMGRNVSELQNTRIGTPNPKVFWMLTLDGALKKSTNGGKSSSAQNLGEGVKTITGSAPNVKTCWVLAEGNLVFRTTDGGKHWVRLATLNGANFRTIVAIDAQTATVTDASGTAKLTTMDGGATWTVSQ
jgi:hypothetical protein